MHALLEWNLSGESFIETSEPIGRLSCGNPFLYTGSEKQLVGKPLDDGSKLQKAHLKKNQLLPVMFSTNENTEVEEGLGSVGNKEAVTNVWNAWEGKFKPCADDCYLKSYHQNQLLRKEAVTNGWNAWEGRFKPFLGDFHLIRQGVYFGELDEYGNWDDGESAKAVQEHLRRLGRRMDKQGTEAVVEDIRRKLNLGEGTMMK